MFHGSLSSLLLERHLIIKRTPINLILVRLWPFFPHTCLTHSLSRAIYTRRVARHYSICWLKKELSMVHGTLYIFFMNKTFFCQDRKLKFSASVLGFRETLQNFSSFRQKFRQHFSMGNKSCPNELKFCEVSRNNKSKRFWKFQISILTNNCFLFLKKYYVCHVPWIDLFPAIRWCPDVLTFLIKGFVSILN